ncbi:MAG: hypothetical protein JST92_07090, partial [Deltaproteobacteria bacterium]|nr:hypothetical protein [Deltaproteobacteria bacterium]
MVLADDGLTPALGARTSPAPPPPGPHLFRVLDAGRPLLRGARHDLTGVDGVLLGRSARVACARNPQGDPQLT